MGYKVEDVKKEYKPGFLKDNYRVTSRDSEKQNAVSDWQPSEHKASQQARERLSEPKKK
jgi:uncharacterized lipoprotein